MAWTKKQLADARKMYKAKGNRKSWSECIAVATKGGTKKRTIKKATVSGTKKKTAVKKAKAPKKVIIIKRAKVVKIAGIGGMAMGAVKTANSNIDRLEKMKSNAANKTEKAKITRAIQSAKKTKTLWKNLL